MKLMNEETNQKLGVKPRNICIGDLLWIQTIGKCVAEKWFAPALLGVVIVDPDSKSVGEWRYIRGHDFEITTLLAKGEINEKKI